MDPVYNLDLYNNNLELYNNFYQYDKPILDGNFVKNNLDIESVEKIIPESDHVMTYGYGSCFYDQIKMSLQSQNTSHIKKVFDYTIGSQRTNPFDLMTLDGKIIERLNYSFEDYYNVCKTGVTNFILENYKREKEGKPLMALLFSVDREGNPFLFTGKSIADKNSEINSLITHSELRRCYKLCIEEHREIARIAKKTIKFVKINQKQNRAVLEEIAPFWLHEGWEEAWKKRKDFRKLQKTFASLETEARDLEKELESRKNEANEIAITPGAHVGQKSRALDGFISSGHAATKARKRADAFYEANIIEVVGDKNRSVRAPKLEEHQWRIQLLQAIKKYNQESDLSKFLSI